MSSPHLLNLEGYKSETINFKSTADSDISLDVFYPSALDKSDKYTVLLHYHGGFLIMGDRYAYLPYWLLHACASRKWIFVTPDYRLLPESTAQASLEDAVDAYQWVLSALAEKLECKIGSVLLAGSSAGAYLALATAVAVQTEPEALLLIYGMLDTASPRYTTPGTNVFGAPAVETHSILENFPKSGANDTRRAISAYPVPANPATDSRFALVSALHVDALFPDYMTGIDGLSRSIAINGVNAIPSGQRNLFPLSFGDLARLPRTMVVHGTADSAVPVEQSTKAAEKLQAAGVEVHLELSEGGEHGFDVRLGDLDVEGPNEGLTAAVQSLRKVIHFLQESVKS